MSQGRLTKFTPETQKIICDAVSEGTPLKYAAMMAGIAERTVGEWLKRGKANRGNDYAAFYDAIQKAKGHFVAANVAKIGRAATEREVVITKEVMGSDGKIKERTTTKKTEYDWTAAAWLLERTSPEHFASLARELRETKKMVTELMTKVVESARGGHAAPTPLLPAHDQPDAGESAG